MYKRQPLCYVLLYGMSYVFMSRVVYTTHRCRGCDLHTSRIGSGTDALIVLFPASLLYLLLRFTAVGFAVRQSTSSVYFPVAAAYVAQPYAFNLSQNYIRQFSRVTQLLHLYPSLPPYSTVLFSFTLSGALSFLIGTYSSFHLAV